MAIARANLAPVAYWNEVRRKPQRFYIAFCLLMSSIQDAVLGSKERFAKNMNWSATCSYYSLVHAGRMLVFLALGDYPELHKDLRQLLSGRGKCNKGKWWLDGFIKYAHQPLDGAQIGLEKPGGYDNSELVGIVVEYLASICLDGPKQEVERFGEVLAGAAELRNDSNYEALLIAHEYNHEFLSPAFEELATLLIEATDNVLPFACTAFNNFIIHDAAWGKERETYGSFARDYLQQRLVRGIGEKLCAVPVHERKALEHKVQGFIAGIANCFNDSDYQQLEDAVSFDVFHCKNGLMHQFQKKIDALVNAIRAN